MFQKFLVLAIVLIGLSSVGYAQIVHGLNEATNLRLGGNNYIIGKVYDPDGRPVERRIRIRLTTQTQGDFVESTDAFGQFIFGGLPEGRYTVAIDREDGIEASVHSVEILRSYEPIKQAYSVSIRLRQSSVATPKPAVVDANAPVIPKEARDLYDNAVKLSAAKEHKKAAAELIRAIAAFPQFGDAYNELGVQYMQLNDLEKADEALTAALKIRPDSFEPTLNRGIAFFRLKRFTDAEGQLRTAIGIKGDSAIAYYYLGRTLTSLSKFPEAEEALLSSLTHGGSSMNETHRMLADLFLEKGDIGRAIDSLETYLKLVPAARDADRLREVIQQLKDQKARQPPK